MRALPLALFAVSFSLHLIPSFFLPSYHPSPMFPPFRVRVIEAETHPCAANVIAVTRIVLAASSLFRSHGTGISTPSNVPTTNHSIVSSHIVTKIEAEFISIYLLSTRSHLCVFIHRLESADLPKILSSVVELRDGWNYIKITFKFESIIWLSASIIRGRKPPTRKTVALLTALRVIGRWFIDEERGDLYIELILRASSVFHPSLCPLKCHRSRVSIIVKEMQRGNANKISSWCADRFVYL